MDGSRGHDALIFLSFLGQSDCKNSELQHELQSLSRDLSKLNDGEIQCDGHSNMAWASGNISDLVGDIHPRVELPSLGNQVDAEALRAVTLELREIADLFERSVLARATESFANKLCNSTINMWKAHLTLEVEWIVKHSQRSDLPQERVMMALALTLVKGVCVKTPQWLRSLFDTTMQYLE
ncbi:hypothetical protein NHX12_003588 [Muraenolepis orangiensis]|uniref:BH3-interacting domain death agonist n=1 Tax=Muraenolepis orangiensis TaxID=630683 RepID=A0A9Q0DZH8_9TELE|nr:hypothetical protein NHX12_003588 [Muraenolepis orangiensis]